MYKGRKLVSGLSDKHTELAQRYAERVRQASATPAGKSRYVPGSDVDGDELRVFSERPITTGPLGWQLCESELWPEEATRPLLIAPDSSFERGWAAAFLAEQVRSKAPCRPGSWANCSTF